ncbi:type II toxin-antitoxin system RelE/ParE family toxin [Undibacterium sp. FT147W]|uniref:Type II toxin-antitoxin system RelE/ParE family toxin n=1 Tax=Undibacterium rivi TaxID=2828729 RepID=A0ABS5H6Y6_9BURK|nr:type II toxin-antitoxin system RelE/ParE family toxin [Undibacterium rivi]MBR7793899.1 type II toxin-antitoxin system RelE/ParE family toxin [Undibacterium rivi]
MMKLAITHDASKYLQALQAKQYKQVGSTVLKLLADPEPHDSQGLKGAKQGERRVDIGEYRIIYHYNNDTVFILVIGKRNDDDVYKVWERQS